MCIIIACRKGTSKNSEFLMKAIKTSAITNDDGMGFMFKKHETNQIYLSKGYKKVEEFLSKIDEFNLHEEDELIIHLRIGNKGAVNTDMCHPFVCSDVDSVILSNNEYVQLPVFAHNGTIHSYSVINSDKSDTFNFAKEVLSNDFIIDMLLKKPELFDKLFKNDLSGSRLAFLFPNSDLQTVGNFLEEEGYLFSNSTYKDSKFRNVGGYQQSIDYGSEDLYAVTDYRQTSKSTSRLKNKIPNIFSSIINRQDRQICEKDGVEYTLYMGLWIPDSVRFNIYKEVMFDINKINYRYLKLICTKASIKDCLFFSQIYHINNLLINQANDTQKVSISQAFSNLGDTIYMDQEEILEYFDVFPKQGIHVDIFNDYIDFVKLNEPSKNKLNKLSRSLSSRAKESSKVKVKGQGEVHELIIRMYIYNACKEMYPMDYSEKYRKFVPSFTPNSITV